MSDQLDRIEAAEQEVYRLAKGSGRAGGRSFRMTVPVEPTDSDIVLIDGLAVARELLAERDALAAVAEALLAAWGRVQYVVYVEDRFEEDRLIEGGLTLDEPMHALRAAYDRTVAKP